MRHLPVTHAIVWVLLSSAAMFADTSDYQKGTITKQSGGLAPYEIDAGSTKLGIDSCGKFQNGQAVEFRIDGDKVYIRREKGGESKCGILTRSGNTAAFLPPPPTYLKGTILGYGVRRDTHFSSGANGSVSSWNRKAKVYELRGPDLIYQVDYCGAFQAGQFSAGQTVEFRVAEKEGRLYICHDLNKEYSCQLEGTRLPDNAPAPTTSATAPPSAASADAKSTNSDDQKK